MSKVTIDERQLFVAVKEIIKSSGLRKSALDDDLAMRVWFHTVQVFDTLRIESEASKIRNEELQVLMDEVEEQFGEALKKLGDSELQDYVKSNNYEEL